MILGQSSRRQTASLGQTGRATLDDLFRHAAARRANEIALVDPANREAFTDGAPRRLTYAQADRMISAIAGRLRRLGLQTDQIVGFQLPNTVEAILTLLGILRAGLIAAPIPLLWRKTEAVAALSRLGATALITAGRVGSLDCGELAMHVAAEVFPIRHVCGFGRALGDGMVPFDDLFSAERLDALHLIERPGNPATHIAAITWDVTADGLVPVARSHLELLTAGLSVGLEGRIERDAPILSAMPIASFAGLALTVLPWLVAGGTLYLHQPFDAATFDEQRKNGQCAIAIVPGTLTARLAEGGLLSRRDGTKTVIAAWRAPERLAVSPSWRDTTIAMVDICIFGEIGLFAARRGTSGRPAAVGFGLITAPRGAPGAVAVAEIARTESGTVAMRGPMVPQFPYPPGAERNDAPYFKVDADGFVDTGYTCRMDRAARALIVTGPPLGIVSVGGYRFALHELQDLAARVKSGTTLAAVPDALTGHRLAGSAVDRTAMREELAALEVNPLIVGAFRERRPAAL